MWISSTTEVPHATLFDLVLFIIVILVLLYIAGIWKYKYFKRQGIPSTKPKIPFLGDMGSVFIGNKSFPDLVMEQYKMSDGHEVFGFFRFTNPVYLVRDPELLKVICVKEFDSFMNHRSVQTEKADPLFSKSLFNLKDQAWRDMRTTLSPAFTTNKIKAMVPLISECGHQMAQHLRQKCADNKGHLLPIDMKDLFTRLANDVIATAVFGVSCDTFQYPDNVFYKMGYLLTNFTKKCSVISIAYVLVPKLMQALGLRVLDGRATSFFDALVHRTIRERKEKGIFRPDMLQLLMQAREGKLKADEEDTGETEEVGAKSNELTDEDVSAQAVTFFFVGFETAFKVLCLTTHLLSHHEEVQKRLYEEVAEVMNKTDGKPTYESVQGMKYMDAVIDETLRLYPPNPVTDRVCREETQLPAGANSGPVTVRKGNLVSVPNRGLHLDPKYWPDPETFDPERFNDENKHKIKPFTYMPFGAGPRLCIGQRFALVEVKLALVHLLANFELHPCSKTEHPLVFQAGFTLIAKGGFWCGLKPRES